MEYRHDYQEAISLPPPFPPAPRSHDRGTVSIDVPHRLQANNLSTIRDRAVAVEFTRLRVRHMQWLITSMLDLLPSNRIPTSSNSSPSLDRAEDNWIDSLRSAVWVFRVLKRLAS